MSIKKLSEYQDEEALEVLSKLLDPIVDICGDEGFQEFFNDAKSKKNKLQIIKFLMSNYKSEITQILAILHGQKVEDYHFTIASLILDLSEILNDSELISFFNSQSSKTVNSASGSAMENTEEIGTM